MILHTNVPDKENIEKTCLFCYVIFFLLYKFYTLLCSKCKIEKIFSDEQHEKALF